MIACISPSSAESYKNNYTKVLLCCCQNKSCLRNVSCSYPLKLLTLHKRPLARNPPICLPYTLCETRPVSCVLESSVFLGHQQGLYSSRTWPKVLVLAHHRPCTTVTEAHHNPPTSTPLLSSTNCRSSYTTYTALSITYRHYSSACSSYQHHYWDSWLSRSLLVPLTTLAGINMHKM